MVADQFNEPLFNEPLFNDAPTFADAVEELRDVSPYTHVEFIDVDGNVTDISAYYESGGTIEWIKERAPDEIQAGDFDIVLFNHDNTFSEYDPTSLIYNKQYHGAVIRISHGFRLSDGSIVYKPMATGYIDQLMVDPGASRITFRCRDIIRQILDGKLHNRSTTIVAVAAAANIGNGSMSDVAVKPFKTKTENWTLTCTLGGADGIATFSVVGSVSGNVGTATSGTLFSTGSGAGGIRFTISGGGTNWAAGDVITFSTQQGPEWSAKNPAKIIWSILTGYDYDSNTPEPFTDLVINLDPTQSDANTDINFASIQTAVTNLSADQITGYVNFEEDAVTVLQGLIILSLSSLFTDSDGRLNLKTFRPIFGIGIRSFADSKKITGLGYNRSIDETINYAVVQFKKTNIWEFSDETTNYDGVFVVTDSASIDKYGILGFGWVSRWYSATGVHVEDFANRLVNKFAEPPLVVNFDTLWDGLESEIGDRINVTDSKYKLAGIVLEISRIIKQFDQRPVTISITGRRDNSLDFNYGFLGSSAAEGDGLSPQASTYGAATESDKAFAYLGTATGAPDYRMY